MGISSTLWLFFKIKCYYRYETEICWPLFFMYPRKPGRLLAHGQPGHPSPATLQQVSPQPVLMHMAVPPQLQNSTLALGSSRPTAAHSQEGSILLQPTNMGMLLQYSENKMDKYRPSTSKLLLTSAHRPVAQHGEGPYQSTRSFCHQGEASVQPAE